MDFAWLSIGHSASGGFMTNRFHAPGGAVGLLALVESPRAASLTEPGFANLVTGARAMTRADNRGLAGIPGAVLGLFVAGNLLVVVIGLLALVGAGVLEALTRRRA
jgi:hypothetical protein